MSNDEPRDGRGHAPGSHATRIRKGEVRNPKGRPKGAMGIKADFNREMKRLVTIEEDGRSVRLPMRRVLLRSMIAKATKDPKFAALILDEQHRHDLGDRLETRERQRQEARSFYGLKSHLDNLSDEDMYELARKHKIDVPSKKED